MGMKILTEISFSWSKREERRTRGHGVTLARKGLSADCVGASSVNIFKNKIDIYL